jgi:hypothetical protein
MVSLQPKGCSHQPVAHECTLSREETNYTEHCQPGSSTMTRLPPLRLVSTFPNQPDPNDGAEGVDNQVGNHRRKPIQELNQSIMGRTQLGRFYNDSRGLSNP